MGKGLYWKLAWGNLRKNYRVTLPYVLSATGVCMMFYMMWALCSGIDRNTMYGGDSIAAMMELGVYVIGIFAVLFLFYTNSFIMKRRKKELGLYNILGMEKRHIGRVIFAETFLVALGCVVLGIGLGILFSKVMFLALGKVLDLAVPIAFMVPVSAVWATAVFFLAIFFLIMLYNILQVRLSKPIELLHGSEVGEKEPKAHWLLAVLGLLLLGGGYWLAVTIQSPIEALLYFFLAVVLVILGTYLLFMTGITALLKLLKKNKGFYYKTRHFTAVSGMLYRMKQNAAGLASICILSTCLLVTVSTTFSLYTGMEDMVAVRYPRAVMLQAVEPNEAAIVWIQDTAQRAAKEAGTAQVNVMERSNIACWTGARRGSDINFQDETYSNDYATVEFCTLAEYNRVSGRNETLGENEILLGDPRHSFPDESVLSMNGIEFSMRRTDYDFAGSESIAGIYEVYYVVVQDEAALDEVMAKGDHIDLHPAYTYYFDLEDETALEAVDDALWNILENELPQERLKFTALQSETSAGAREDFLNLYGGLFFLGMFLGLLFLLGTALIIYYKQVSEGYEDARRFQIMQKVGMSRAEVKRSIHSQIILVFFLPLLAAMLHLAFAFPMLQKILALLNMVNFQLILFSTVGCVAVFAVFYFIIYACTARTYYKIVEQG